MYTVLYFNCSVLPLPPSELQIWLNQRHKDGFELVAATGDYFIFRERVVGEADEPVLGEPVGEVGPVHLKWDHVLCGATGDVIVTFNPSNVTCKECLEKIEVRKL